MVNSDLFAVESLVIPQSTKTPATLLASLLIMTNASFSGRVPNFVPNLVPSGAHFCRALLGHFSRAPKPGANENTLIRLRRSNHE
jgi:hypothetical protein